jgi:tRNA (cmo5U34)-methyltransferase
MRARRAHGLLPLAAMEGRTDGGFQPLSLMLSPSPPVLTAPAAYDHYRSRRQTLLMASARNLHHTIYAPAVSIGTQKAKTPRLTLSYRYTGRDWFSLPTRKDPLNLVTNQEPKNPADFFDQQRASHYDNQWAKLAPLRDAIHLLIRIILLDLPTDAHILCIGVGTGSELIDLAQTFPEWRFTAVEPAAPMLAVCRQRAEEKGIASRCTFHEGFLDSLPSTDPFDAATSLLVSHFLLRPEDQQAFFAQIAFLLKLDGYLINSAIASDRSTDTYQSLLGVWLRMQAYTGASPESLARLAEAYERDVAVLPPAQIESLLASSGFSAPVPFYRRE